MEDFGDYTSEDILCQEEREIAEVDAQLKQFETCLASKVMEIKGMRPLAELIDLSFYPYGIHFTPAFSKELLDSGIERLKHTTRLSLAPALLIDRVEIESAVESVAQGLPEFNREVEYVADFLFLDGSKRENVHHVSPFYCLDNYSEIYKMTMKDYSPVKIVELPFQKSRAKREY